MSDSEVTELYRRFPIDSNNAEIRLLKLTSTRGELRGQLQVASLNGKLTYAGLSYVWVEPKPTSYMICNGVRLPITASLRGALLQLRHHGHRILWVDQICIQQADINERTGQVNLMTRIYTVASQVLVWLGDADGNTAMAFEFCSQLSEYANDWNIYTGKVYTGFLDALPSLPRLPDASDPRWIALMRLLYRPWFRRVWIVQEVSNCAAVTVCCGYHTVHYSDLWASLNIVHQNTQIRTIFIDAMFTQITRHETYLLIESMVSMLAENIQAPKDFVRLDNVLPGESQQPHPLKLFRQLCAMRSRRCSKAEDKVNGVITHLSRRCNINDVPRTDCALSVEAVYIRTARYFIIQGIGVEVLQKAGIQQRAFPDLPSWCPDLSQQRCIEFSEVQEAREGTYTYTKHPRYRFKAVSALKNAWLIPPRTQSAVRLGLSDDTVVLTTRLVDTISSLGPTRTGHLAQKLVDEYTVDGLSAWEQSTRRIIVNDLCLSKRDRTPQATLWEYSRALVTPVTDLNSRFCNLQFPCVGLESVHRNDPELKPTVGEFPGFLHEEKRAYRSTCEGVIDQRRAGVTRSGFIGVFPGAAQSGDRICVVNGADFPLVVRRKVRETPLIVEGRRRWTFELVGDASVYGLDVGAEMKKGTEVRLYLI